MGAEGVIIVGAGPAGLTAAIYASRRNLKTLVLSKGLSDQVSEILQIENYPGFEKIKGYELIQKFENGELIIDDDKYLDWYAAKKGLDHWKKRLTVLEGIKI